MNTPNWQHHSKKEAKRKLKPQALRSRKDALAITKEETYWRYLEEQSMKNMKSE